MSLARLHFLGIGDFAATRQKKITPENGLKAAFLNEYSNVLRLLPHGAIPSKPSA